MVTGLLLSTFTGLGDWREGSLELSVLQRLASLHPPVARLSPGLGPSARLQTGTGVQTDMLRLCDLGGLFGHHQRLRALKPDPVQGRAQRHNCWLDANGETAGTAIRARNAQDHRCIRETASTQGLVCYLQSEPLRYATHGYVPELLADKRKPDKRRRTRYSTPSILPLASSATINSRRITLTLLDAHRQSTPSIQTARHLHIMCETCTSDLTVP
ncbi:uncharacterized protein F5Z01DRAFT_633946 [Emericellopsis atlantica]|uniref:Uncharacterized protein n=1 Tax=Emericellopsis atlantica TaxID=2614577 RepID=A0A9P7ZST4_9HYPO|nr:uncharacterized protein F5Z01DRAFT_633946 [Emericellopsis atlantica]KAG9257182.1 hypothetical protein F5Z01DRAFT_633946 [Emericellopsis atlantica]